MNLFSKTRVITLLIITFIICFFYSNLLLAQQKRIAILPFSGLKSNQIRSRVISSLRNDYDIISQSELSKVKNELGLSYSRSEDLTEMAKELDISAFIDGSVSKVGSNWGVVIKVINGADGEELGRSSVSAKNLKKLNSATGRLINKISSLIEDSIPPQESKVVSEVKNVNTQKNVDKTKNFEESTGLSKNQLEAMDEESPWSRPKVKQQKQSEKNITHREAKHTKSKKSYQVEDEEIQTKNINNEPSAKKGGHSPYGYLDLNLIFGGMYRDFYIPLDPEVSKIDNESTSSISFTPSFLIFGAGFSFFPGSIFNDKWYAHLGIDFSYNHHIYLKVVNNESTIDSEEYGLYIGGVYRLTLGRIDFGAIINFRIGFGRLAFLLNKTPENDTLPSFVYDYIKIGLDLYVPLGTTYIGVTVGGGYLAGLGIGEEAASSFSTPGSDIKPKGFNMIIGIGGTIIEGLKWNLGLELDGFSTSYIGSGTGPNGNVTIKPTDSSLDLYWLFLPKISYTFGWNPESRIEDEFRESPDENDHRSNDEDSYRNNDYESLSNSERYNDYEEN